MAHSSDTHSMDDPHSLSRFLQAQADCYEQALSELRSGRKRTHWMWFIFPQFKGLASSPTSQHYSIKSIEEARAYLNHPVLGPRLLQCAQAVLSVEGRSATEILGSPDDVKLRSCATLFSHVSAAGSVFELLLAKYFPAGPDEKTLSLLGADPASR